MSVIKCAKPSNVYTVHIYDFTLFSHKLIYFYIYIEKTNYIIPDVKSHINDKLNCNII